jgi:hypothetical protein
VQKQKVGRQTAPFITFAVVDVNIAGPQENGDQYEYRQCCPVQRNQPGEALSQV